MLIHVNHAAAKQFSKNLNETVDGNVIAIAVRVFDKLKSIKKL